MANLPALLAIVLWSFLAYFGVRFAEIPSLLIVGIALCVSGAVGMVRLRAWRVPLRTLFVGVVGIFGYHFLYFSAFQRAPAVEVNLINYLWPLLIVLLSPLILQNYRLQIHHLIGAGMGLAGAFVIIGGGKISLELNYIAGYALAGGAALVWALYSLMTKRLPTFSTSAVGAFCLISGIMALGVYVFSDIQFRLDSISSLDWIALIGLGLGPMGLAFYAWDAALKRGDPRVIGSLSYLTPLFSTLILVILGGHRLSMNSGIAMALIVGGAVIGSWDILKRAPAISKDVEHKPGSSSFI